MSGLLQFRFKNQLPPGGQIFYKVQETGVVLTGNSIEEVHANAVKHMVDNGIVPPPNLPALIEDYVCQNVDGSFCVGSDGLPTKRPSSLTIWQVFEFTRLLFTKLVFNPHDFFVDPGIANKRAQTCSTCPLNRAGICTSCSGIKQRFASMMARRSTKFDGALHVCTACGCWLPAKVHIANKYLDQVERKQPELPDHCWRKKEST